MTVTSSARAGVNGRVPAVRAGAPLPTRQKRPGYVALGVMLVVGFAAIGAYLYGQAGRKVPVVVVVNHVGVGQVVTRSDLSTVQVAGGVTAIGGANIQSAVGETATVELLPGTLLQRSMLSTAPALGVDQALVGVQVAPGQLPADGLKPGDTVEVLRLPTKDATPDATTGSFGSGSAVVVVPQSAVDAATGDPSQTGGTLLTLLVARGSAPAVAAASGAGVIALVRVGS